MIAPRFEYSCRKKRFSLTGSSGGAKKKMVIMVDGFWMKENGKEVKRLEGIGLVEVETWEIGVFGDFVIGIR